MSCSCRTMPSFLPYTCWAQEWEGAHWLGPCTWCTQSHQLVPGKVQFYNLAWEQVLTFIEETREAVSVHEVSARDESESNIGKFAVKHSHALDYSRQFKLTRYEVALIKDWLRAQCPGFHLILTENWVPGWDAGQFPHQRIVVKVVPGRKWKLEIWLFYRKRFVEI